MTEGSVPLKHRFGKLRPGMNYPDSKALSSLQPILVVANATSWLNIQFQQKLQLKQEQQQHCQALICNVQET
eukprot:3478668-Heterocapsa_arctica.AAC.1